MTAKLFVRHMGTHLARDNHAVWAQEGLNVTICAFRGKAPAEDVVAGRWRALWVGSYV